MDFSVIPSMISAIFTCESSAAHGAHSSVSWLGNGMPSASLGYKKDAFLVILFDTHLLFSPLYFAGMVLELEFTIWVRSNPNACTVLGILLAVRLKN